MITQTSTYGESPNLTHVHDPVGRDTLVKLWSNSIPRIFVQETFEDGTVAKRAVSFSLLERSFRDNRSLGPISEEGFLIETENMITYTLRNVRLGNVTMHIHRAGYDPLFLELDTEFSLVAASRDLLPDEVDLSLRYAQRFVKEWCRPDESIVEFLSTEGVLH